jgi:hypothetical protein
MFAGKYDYILFIDGRDGLPAWPSFAGEAAARGRARRERSIAGMGEAGGPRSKGLIAEAAEARPLALRSEPA